MFQILLQKKWKEKALDDAVEYMHSRFSRYVLFSLFFLCFILLVGKRKEEENL